MNKTGFCILLGIVQALCMAQNEMNNDSADRFLLVKPESRIRVGFDFDGDNRVDAYDYMSGRDLMISRGQSPQQPQMSLTAMSGEIDDLKQVRLTGMPERHVVGRIETSNGLKYAVDLGPKSQVSRLDLDNGDWISIRGVQGSINRNKMLMATQIRTEDRQVSINRPEGLRQLRFAGEIKETSVRSLGPGRPDHLLALVELDDKEKVVVDLGSDAALKRQDLDLSRNDDIVFLASPSRFEGKNLLRATRLGVNGEMYQLSQTAL